MEAGRRGFRGCTAVAIALFGLLGLGLAAAPASAATAGRAARPATDGVRARLGRAADDPEQRTENPTVDEYLPEVDYGSLDAPDARLAVETANTTRDTLQGRRKDIEVIGLVALVVVAVLAWKGLGYAVSRVSTDTEPDEA